MKVLILSPHSDDAELGCGGTIVKLLEEGHDVSWMVFSTSEESLPVGLPMDTLRREFTEVVNALQIEEDKYKILSYRVRYLHEHRQEILEELVRMRDDYSPDVVIGPSINDYHQDHQVIANEMIRAFKTNSSIISYELPWNHITFNTQLFMRLEKRHITHKFELLQKYKSQLMQGRAYFTREYVTGLAKTRGVQCDSDFAEAFEVIRWMI